MNFLDALNAHVMWKQRLKSYVAGTSEEELDPEHICLDNQCVLGKWLYGHRDALERSELFEKVRSMHATFHESAADIVRLTQKGKAREAERLLNGGYADISHQLQGLIRKLAREHQYEAPAAESGT
ncbi:MAG TPA: chemotaxis protein [Gammaproteobacteria bacterium]|nr:chemotaxis protein [Gammaproteobacteria bacterium]